MIDDPGSIQRMRSIAAHCLLWMNDSHRVHETKDSVAVDQSIHWEEIGDPEAVRVLYALVDHGQTELHTDKDRDERAAQMRGRRIIGATVIGVCIASLATIVLKSEHNAPQRLHTRASLDGTNSPRGATFARVGIPGGDRQDYDVNHSIASMALVAGMMPIAASVAQAQCSTDGYAWPSGSFGFANGQHCSELAAGRDFVVALQEDGTLQKFGSISAPPSGSFIAVAAQHMHAIAIRSDRRVVAWGSNIHGQATVPTDLPEAALVATSYTCSAIIGVDGRIHTWGMSEGGQTVSPLGFFTAIDGGERHFIAISASGEVMCWGQTSGANVPTDIGPCIAVAAGGGIFSQFTAGHSVAVRPDGSIRCWGDNGQGQCSVPLSLDRVTAVSAGGPHTVALLANGTVRAWGASANGQIAITSPPNIRLRKLATGEQSTFAISESLNSDGDGPCCPADLTRDGQVNGADLGAVLAFWGQNPAYQQADINADGRVDGADLGALLANWGLCGQ
jgi:hypothetical protein